MNLSKNLKLLRHQKGLLVKEVAAYLHCSVGTVSNYENGVHEPDCDSLCRLADLYDVTIDSLLDHAVNRVDADITSQIISGEYTISRLLLLLPRLSKQDRSLLVYLLCLMEKTADFFRL